MTGPRQVPFPLCPDHRPGPTLRRQREFIVPRNLEPTFLGNACSEMFRLAVQRGDRFSALQPREAARIQACGRMGP
jgi:hypothetical protein